MKVIHYCTKIISTKYAGDIDTLVTEIFIGFIFGAYTYFMWTAGGRLLPSVTGVVSALCFLRVGIIVIELLGKSSSIASDSSVDKNNKEGIGTEKRKGSRSRRFKIRIP